MNKYNIYKINNKYYTKVLFDGEQIASIERIEDISKKFYLPKETLFTSTDNFEDDEILKIQSRKPIATNYKLLQLNSKDAQYAYYNKKVITDYIMLQFKKACTFSKLLNVHAKYGFILDQIVFFNKK